MRNKIRLYLIGLLAAISSVTQAQALSDSARISLVTCAPGEELYARFGHTALRVYDPENKLDVVFNYGIFDFNTDHFYWKFVRGETWYELGCTSMRWFLLEYEQEKRAVYQQELLLTPEEREALWQALIVNAQPENKQYLYNFVFDNCATRPYHLIDKACRDSISSSYTGYTGETYRTFIRHYTGRYSWSNAGINLLFGRRADQPMNSEQRLFLPEELMLYMQQAQRSDGTPLVRGNYTERFVIAKTPWYHSWPFGLVLYFLFVFLMSLYDLRRRKLSLWVDILAAIPYVLLLLIVAFLTFFSCHPLVGFGWRLLIIPVTHLCARSFYFILRR